MLQSYIKLLISYYFKIKNSILLVSLKNNVFVFFKIVKKLKNNIFEFIIPKILYCNSIFSIFSLLLINKLNLLYIDYLKVYITYFENKIKYIYNYYLDLEKNFSFYLDANNENKFGDKIIKQNKSISYYALVNVLNSRQKNKTYAANPSLWPAFLSFFAGISFVLFVVIIHNQGLVIYLNKQIMVAIFGSIVCISFWITTFYKEKQLGYHTYEVRRNIRLGFYIFIFTEALCFLSLFWTLFHALLAASFTIGQFNPGEGIVNFWLTETRILHPLWNIFFYSDANNSILLNLTDSNIYQNKDVYNRQLAIKVHINLYDKGQLINPYKYPLINTLILLSSAGAINCSHVKLKLGRYLASMFWLIFTIAFGFLFILIQFTEIKNCTMQFSDGIFASCFYSLTGLHGTHVILGVFALIMCLINIFKNNYSQKRHDTYWFAILYWHFVDVVWILVYLIAYVWPSMFFFWTDIFWTWLDFRSYCFNISKEAFEKSVHRKLYHDCNVINQLICFYTEDTINEADIKYKNFFVSKLNNENKFISNLDLLLDLYQIEKKARYNRLRVLFKLSGYDIDKVKLKSRLFSNEITESHVDFDTTIRSKIKKLSYKWEILLHTNWIYETLDSFNYNKIKKNTAEHAVVYNILHFAIFSELNSWMASDMKKKYYKFVLFNISKCLNERFTFFWSKHYMSYMIDQPVWKKKYVPDFSKTYNNGKINKSKTWF